MRSVVVLITVLLFSCQPKQSPDEAVTQPESSEEDLKQDIGGKLPEAYSISGDSLYEPARSPEALSKLEEKLDDARTNWENNPTEVNYIWLGRRTAYISRYTEAIRIYSEGIEKFPDSYKLYRHRGHRYISTRKFDLAILDFNRAAELVGDSEIEIEEDGMPNKLNIPLSNTHFNIYYHLGLAYYLKGDWDNALTAYNKCLKYCVNDDLLTATLDWLYMTFRKLNKKEDAISVLQFVNSDMEIVENSSYYKRLLMYKGYLPVDSLLSTSMGEIDDVTLVTQGYGVANYLIEEGKIEEGKKVLSEILENKNWSAFGYIASEADMARMNE